MWRSGVQFVEVDGLDIAWEQYGEGPDCVIVPPLISNIELLWEHEYYRRVLEFMGRHLKVIHLDKRGMGLSDRIDGAPTLEDRVHDVEAVMDAAGVERAHVIGISEGGAMAQGFAARHPHRVDRLVLANSLVLGYETPPRFAERTEHFLPEVIENWGRNGRPNIEWWSPSNADNEAFVRWWARYQRLAATRSEFEQQLQSILAVQRTPDDFLDDITAPTLVVNSSGDPSVDPESGAQLASRIASAERRVVDNDDHFYFLGEDWLEPSQTIVEFLLESSVDAPSERAFATVVFTDIVGSTAQLSSRGDEAWSSALDDHDQVAWDLADRLGATIVKSTGDGLVVRFGVPQAAVDFCRDLAAGLAPHGLPIRAGIHAGEIEIRPNQDITGIAVNIAARVEQAAADGEIWVSSTVRDILLGGDQQFDDAGEHTLKGIDGTWRLYRLT